MPEPDKKSPAAVYVAWGTFKNAIEGLAQAIPNRIDKTVYPGLNPAVVSQLLTAYKFLGLTEDNGKPTALLQSLAVKDEGARKQQLEAIIAERYADLFALDLLKTTPAEISEKIEKSYGVSGDTREKAIRFFLGAITYLGIPVSPLLTKVATNGGTRKKRTPKQRVDPPPPPPPSGAVDGNTRIINLASGGTLTLSVSMNFLALIPADRKFFSDLIDRLDEYEKGTIQ